MKLFVVGLSTVAANACTSKGGTCTDWRYTNCPAGYQQGICPGDANQRCCLNCNPSCQADEEYFQQFDGPCENGGGACLIDSNYCSGSWQSGKCGGYNNRKCCSSGHPDSGGSPTEPTPTDPPSGETGDYFWNSYTGYTLDGDASNTNYSSFSAAQNACIGLGNNCMGITLYSGRYYLKRNVKFILSGPSRCWTKEEKWAANYVPRAEWGGREPKSVTNLSIPAPVGVIGHHTAGGRCSTYSACVSQIKGMQNYHMDTLGWVDIGYQYIIGEDGRIYEGRGPYRQGSHTYGWNAQTIGFSVAGDFSYTAPNQAAMNAVYQLLDYLERKNLVNRSCWSFYGHRDKDATICPGNPLYADWGSHKNWHKRC